MKCVSGQKLKGRTQIALSFSLYFVLYFYLAHPLRREAMEASYWARLILAGELRANPVR